MSLFIALVSIVLTFCVNIKSRTSFFLYVSLICVTVVSLVYYADGVLK